MTTILVLGILSVLGILILVQLKPQFSKRKDVKTGHEEQSALAHDYSIDYSSVNQRILDSGMVALIGFALGYIYYHQLILAVLFAVLAVVTSRTLLRNRRIKKYQCQLLMEFQEGIYNLLIALSAGRSMEQAFVQSVKELKEEEYPLVYREFTLICNKLEANLSLEACLVDLAQRAHIEEISNFVDVIVTCRRTQGDVIKVIRRTLTILGEKTQIQKDVQLMLSGKKFEQRILMAMPSFVLLFLAITSKGLLEPMYTTLLGRLLMTGALGINIVSYYISHRIVDIEV